MAEFIDKVTEVTLVYGASNIAAAQFNIPLVLAAHQANDQLVGLYTSPKAVLDAGFSEKSPAYIMANKIFLGDSRPGKVFIGKRELISKTWHLSDPLPDTTQVTITLKSGKLTKDFKATKGTLEAIVDQVSADDVWGKIFFLTLGALTVHEIKVQVLPNQFGDFSVSVGDVSTEHGQGVLNDLLKVQDKEDSWLWLVTDTHASADVLDLAAYTKASDKIYKFTSQDPDILNRVEGNLLQKLTEGGYETTGMTLWRDDADKTFDEACDVGAICNFPPGTTTLHGKTFSGTDLQKLTTTQENNIVSQNGNIYRKDHGTLFYRDGRMVTGDFCDTILHALWVKARTAESVTGLLKSRSRLGSGVRFTTKGIDSIYQAIWNNPINPGIQNGSIADEITRSETSGQMVDLRPTITMPSRADIPTSEVSERLLDGVVVEYVYAGFIHYVKVRVNVLVNREATQA